MTIAETMLRMKTIKRDFYRIEMDLGFDSSIVEALISLSLFMSPWSPDWYPVNEDTDAKEQISSLSS